MRRKVEDEDQKDCKNGDVQVQWEERVDLMETSGSKAAVLGEVEEGEVENGECEEGEDHHGREFGTRGHQGPIEALA